jgi:hypothetical protein
MGCIGRSRWARISLVSSLLLGSPAALAQPSQAAEESPLRVLWTSEDPECDGGDVAARALSLVSPGVVPRPLRASVEVRREGPLWVVQLETRSGEQTGRRSLKAESCREIEGALALLLAMTMESGLDAPPPEPAAPPPAPDVPPASAPPPAPPPTDELDELDEPAQPPADDEPGLYRGLFLRITGAAGWGQQPGLALGAGAAAGVRLGQLELGLGGTYWPSTEKQIDALDGASISIRRQSLGLRACWNAWRAGNVVLVPCLSPGVVMYHVESAGLVRNRTNSVPPGIAVGAGAELRYELFGGAMALSLGGGINMERPQPFEVEPIVDQDDAEDENVLRTEPLEVYNTRAIAPRIEVGLDARF